MSREGSITNARRITDRKRVIETRWFDLVAKTIAGDQAPHYSIATSDYVCVVAVTADGAFPLVRQFRPAIEQMTIELPSGHVDEGETPEQSARKELLEETGFVAESFIPLGTFSSDPGRLGNRIWCFFAPGAVRDSRRGFAPESGIEPVVYGKSLRSLVLSEPEFCSALNRTAILMASAKGHVQL